MNESAPTAGATVVWSRGTMSPSRQVLRATLASNTLGILPAFLFSSLSLLMREDIPVSEARIGGAVSLFFVVSGLSAIPGGHLGQRLGARGAMALGAALTSLSLLGIAFAASGWTSILLFLAAAGLGNGIAQPAANLALARWIPPMRQGLAFGVKQSAAPLATLLIGLLLPTVSLAVGWRWSFALGTCLAPLILLPTAFGGTARSPRAAALPAPPDHDLPPVVPITLVAALGSAAGTCVGAFVLPTAVSQGVSIGAAGLLVVAGSALGLATRIGAGWFADQRDRSPFGLMAAMLALGTCGFLALGMHGSTPTLVVGALLAFAAGWGWPGLLYFGVVRRRAADAARASSIPQAGAMLGSALGPLAFGLIASRGSIGDAWLATAMVTAVATAILVAGGGLRLS